MKPPPPDLVDGEEEWEIEAIMAHKKMQHGIKYLVKWKGFPSSENTWEPASNLRNAQDLLTAYRKVHRLDKSPSTQHSTAPVLPSCQAIHLATISHPIKMSAFSNFVNAANTHVAIANVFP